MEGTFTGLEMAPDRRRGQPFLGSLLVLIVLASLTGFFLASTVHQNWLFGLCLAAGILFLLPVPMLSYRWYALSQAFYRIDRDQFTLHWGWRTEIIPLSSVEWVRPVEDLIDPLPRPPLPLPGAYLGIRQVPGLGRVEYLADRLAGALLVASPNTVYVISPREGRDFLLAYRRFAELGSIRRVQAESIQPSLIIGKLWDDPAVRRLLLGAFLTNAAAFVWTLLLVTSRSEVTFGYSFRVPLQPAPALRLLLLPILSGIIFLVDMIAAAFFYRLDEQRALSYGLIAASSITAALILVELFLVTMGG